MLNLFVKQTAKATLLCILLFVVGFLNSLAQTNTWVQKSDFGYDTANVTELTSRTGAVGFSIGSKGYIGTGSHKNDFWEYNPAADTWTQKANFEVAGRSAAVGFSIGSKGYLGTGYGTEAWSFKRDFWEYDPSANTWKQKANFGGTARERAVGFSIGSKGYIGTGDDFYSLGLKDFWEYDPADDTWTQKADFGGAGRSAAVGFSIGSKGYLGTGSGTKDFWEYDPATDTWTKKADFGGTGRAGAIGFSIGRKGYLGTGSGNLGYTKDFWEYDPAANIWTQKADFDGDPRKGAVGFSIGSKGYLGTGTNGTNYQAYKDFQEYDLAANTWTPKADFGGTSTARYGAIGFSIGSKGYLGTGGSEVYSNDLWEYDPAVNTWTQKADFPGVNTYIGGFSIGSKGYIGSGLNKDFWEYDPATNIWTRKADFLGQSRSEPLAFSIGSKGYMGMGYWQDAIVNYLNDFWEYDPAVDKWTRKADKYFIYADVAFSIGNKGYIGLGGYRDWWDGTPHYLNSFAEYDPAVDIVTPKASFPGGERADAVGFAIGGKGYVGTGYGTGDVVTQYDYTSQKDFWEYDPAADIWTQKMDFGGGVRRSAVGFSIGGKGYMGTGMDAAYGSTKDFWEYTPDDASCPVPANLLVTNITASSVKLKWDAVTGAEAYRLRYKPLRSGNWTDKATPATSEKITGLLPATKYRWDVKTYCHKDPPQVTSDGSAKGEFTTAALSVSNEDVQKVSFQIYPIPAKDILHIQTNGNASFSLVNQVGKVLLTKNINGNGTINVSGFAAGLYYLKNNSSGTVQKVVIAK